MPRVHKSISYCIYEGVEAETTTTVAATTAAAVEEDVTTAVPTVASAVAPRVSLSKIIGRKAISIDHFPRTCPSMIAVGSHLFRTLSK